MPGVLAGAGGVTDRTPRGGAKWRIFAVLGGAECVQGDYERLLGLLPETERPLLVAVNDVGAWWPSRLDAWATLHPELLVERDPDDPDGLSWIERRRTRGLPGGYVLYADRRRDLVHETVTHWGGGGAASYAARVTMHLGADRTVLCGCPLDERPYDGRTKTSHSLSEHLKEYRRGWRRRLRRDHQDAGRFLRDGVRSMSGWTRELLGEPTKEWLRP